MQWPHFHAGAEGGHAACRRRRFRRCAARGGLWDYLQVGVRARSPLRGVPFAASEPQRPDDLVCRVQRRRPGACFAWGCGFRHFCVAVSKSRRWGADFLWLVHLLWARWGVGGRARTLAPRAGVCVLMWALAAPPVACVALVAPLQGASEVRRSPSPRCPPLGGCRGPPPACCGRGCAGLGAQHCPLGVHALRGAACCWGAGGLSWGLAVHCCEGRLVSGALPPPVARPLGGGRPGFRDPCVPGAVGVGLGTQHWPHSVCPCEPLLHAVGVAKGRPRGGCCLLLRGASEFRRSPSPGFPSSAWAVGVRYPRAAGTGVRVWGQHALSPWLVCPGGPCVPRGCCRGWLSPFVRGIWRQALSLLWLLVL